MAAPLVVSTCFWTIMTFTDRMFLLWYSNAAMAAALPAGLVSFTVLCFPFGLVAYISTFVAQYYGAGVPERVGLITWQGLWISLAAAPFVLATVPLAPWIFAWSGHGSEIAALEVEYYCVLAYGAGGTLIATTLSAFFTGLSRTSVVMVIDAIAATLNAVLDYAWIFGQWGFPRWGIAGAAWATVVAQWCAAGMYLAVMYSPRYREAYHIRGGCRLDRALLKRLLYFGSPSGLQLLIEVGAFTLFLLVVGRLGEIPLAATNLAFNINTLAWLPMLGVGMAVSTMVGQQLGRNDADLAARVAWTAAVISLGYMTVVAVLYACVPDLFLLGHAVGMSAQRFASVRDLAVVLLRFVALYCFFDALNLVFSSAIKGAGDTRFVLATAAVLSPVPLVASWVGVQGFGAGILWCWCAVTFWVCALGIVYFARFLQGRWRTMRVIEQEILNQRTPPGLPLPAAFPVAAREAIVEIGLKE
jgi:MATE family multidrug resistance protein